jgi:hypothetical protein
MDRLWADREDLGPWPDWCFVPLAASYAVVTDVGENPVSLEQVYHTGILGALAAWRMTQGIYRFAPALYEALTGTRLTRDIPPDPLYRMPAWCVYIETPDMRWPIPEEERPIRGVWAHLNYRLRNNPRRPDELRLVLDTATSSDDPFNLHNGCIPIELILGEGAIVEALERDAARRVERAQRRGSGITAASEYARVLPSLLEPIISLILYLCTADADVGDGNARPSHPKPKRTKEGWRLFPPDGAIVWNVGAHIGSALRRA